MTDKQSPAFPTMKYEHGGESDGITLRDYFAAKAMQAILIAKYPVTKELDAEHKIAKAAYQGADAMLAARNK
jgi:hypothetical protein